VWQAVLISSVLFGLAHLGNSALRGFSVIVALQAFGAAVRGIGFAALRLRTNTISPPILIHMLQRPVPADGEPADRGSGCTDRHDPGRVRDLAAARPP
jgi:Type II CAAX prenyl endopeptidase Rce1-like